MWAIVVVDRHVPFKMSDESPFPPDATPLVGQRPIRPVTGDSILTIGVGESSVDVSLRMAAQAPAMYELLKELEWAKVDCRDESIDVCPSCNNLECFGHEPNCRLDAVLKAVEGE